MPTVRRARADTSRIEPRGRRKFDQVDFTCRQYAPGVPENNSPEDGDGDAVSLDELHPVGGSWGGLLFDNPTIGLPTRFYWSFEVEFAEVVRDYGTVSPNLVVDWVTDGPGSWRKMQGFEFERHDWNGFEASVYFFSHYRYDSAQLSVLGQQGSRLLVATRLAGDIDGLGLPEVSASCWLDLSQVVVSVSTVDDLERAARALSAAAVDIAELTGEAFGSGFRFSPPPTDLG